MRKQFVSWLALAAFAVSGCSEQTPTSVSEELLPVQPITVEIQLPWEQFASNLQVLGGFGLASERGGGLVANAYRGTLFARSLGHWEQLSPTALARDSTGTLVESQLRLRTGRLIVHFDSLVTRPSQPVTVSAHRLQTEWDARTTTWTLAVDSVGDQRAWQEAGAGPAIRVAQGVWDSSQSDSLVLPVDSVTVRAWTDTLFTERAFRIDLETADQRVEVHGATFRYDAIPTVDPDSIIEREAQATDLTFIYTPVPGAPQRGLRVGGVPSWRSVILMQVPETITGPPATCALLGCPFQLTPERVNHASLVLTTRPSSPLAFQPWDTVRVDVRAVLAPERLPKAPLGNSIAGPTGRALAPALFNAPQQVTIPITSFVRAQLSEETTDGLPPPRALALLSFLEPASVYFASFAGPGETGAPLLRLIVTSAPVVQLP